MQAFLSLALAATRTPKDELLHLAPLAPLAPGTGGCALAVSDDSVPLSAVPNCVPWFGLQTQLAKEAAAYTPAPSGNSTLVLLGDSITEHLRGTQVGAPHLPVVADGARGLLERWPSHLLLGSSGDLAADLLWRLGDAMRDDPALLINLLVGTNDLGSMESAEETAAAVADVARFLLQRSKGRVLIDAILPRFDAVGDLGVIAPTNEALRARAAALAAEFRDESSGAARVAFADCTAAPFSAATAGVTMPDNLHPSGEGYRQLFDGCLQPALEALEAAGRASPGHREDVSR